MYVNAGGVGHGVFVAVLRINSSTTSGNWNLPPLRGSGSPHRPTASAATPAACGDAIDVPCRYW